ncbi:MAG TPA: hypothetical protein VMT53_18030 [Terriglobales bacterium]|nr:hypothetical protein [Terriglobales bacterium]
MSNARNEVMGQRPTTNDQRLTGHEGPAPDTLYYVLALLCGVFAGWVDVKVGDLLFTALLVLAPCILLGALRPQRPWRWTVAVGVFVPIADLLAYLIMTQKLDRAQIYESFLAFLPGLVGAYGGSLMRGVINNVLGNK